jgi:hypothetical protein
MLIMALKPLDCDELRETIAKIANHYGKQPGIAINNSVFSGVVEAVKTHFPNMDRTAISDAIVAYSQRNRKPKSEIQDQLASMRSEAKSDRTAREYIDRMEKLIDGVPLEPKTKRERKAVSDAIAKLRKMGADLKKDAEAPLKAEKLKEEIKKLTTRLERGDYPKGKDKEMGPKQELESIKSDLQAQLRRAGSDVQRAKELRERIKDVQDQIDTGNFTSKEKRSPRNRSADVPILEARLKELEKIKGKLRGPDVAARNARLEKQIERLKKSIADRKIDSTPKELGPKESIVAQRDALQAELRDISNRSKRIKRILDSIESMKWQLRNGVLPKTVREKKVDAEVDALIEEQTFLKRRINQMIEAERPKTPLEKAMNVVNLVRTLRSSGDLPPLFRQGWAGFLTHPVMGFKALARGIAATFSPRAAARYDIQMRDDVYFQKAERDGVFFSPIEGGSMTQREEELISDLAEKIPLFGRVVKMSARGYNTMLNMLSHQIMRGAYRNIDPNIPNYDKVVQEIAARINDYRGRAAAGPKGSSTERFATVVGSLFFSLRNWISRVKMATAYHVWKPGSWEARKLAIKETAKFYAAVSFIAWLVDFLGGEVEKDPRSGGFGKVVIGDQSIDASGQVGSEVNMMVKYLFGERKNMKGEIIPTYGFDFNDRNEGFMQTAKKIRSKLAPGPAMALDLASRSDYSGEPLTEPKQIAAHVGEQLLPMTWVEMFDAYKRESAGTATAFSILAMLGAGQQDLSEKSLEERRAKQKEAQKKLNEKYKRK